MISKSISSVAVIGAIHSHSSKRDYELLVQKKLLVCDFYVVGNFIDFGESETEGREGYLIC